MSKKSNFSLMNTKHYNERLNKSEIILCLKNYNLIIEDFLIKIFETIDYKTCKNLYQIILRGVSCLEHVFNILFLYTKNIILTLYYSNKASNAYIDYINSLIIGSNSEKIIYPIYNRNFELHEIKNSKNAMLCVYDESIKIIDEEYKKNYVMEESEKKYFDVIKSWSKFVNLIFLKGININLSEMEQDILLKNMYEIKKNNEKYIDYLLSDILNKGEKVISTKLEEDKYIINFNNQIGTILRIMIFISQNKLNYKETDSVIKLFIKKIFFKPIDKDVLEQKLIGINVNNMSNQKFIKEIFS